MVDKKDADAAHKIKRSTLQRMQNEDDVADWIEEAGVPEREIAETFAEAGFSTEELQTMREDLGADPFIYVLPWLENLVSSQKIIKDLDDASTRISHLVGSIKSHVQMDRTNELQPTHIHQDIENTLTLLGFKLREKNIQVTKNYCIDMPAVPAYIGELNQVWTNLFDNAIYALGQNGTLTIETSCDPKNITVRIIDNGPGIPKEILSRIFDPFFTTKKVGEGTGIGLDIVNRVVKRHKGTIEVDSEPGRTEFLISLPVIQKTEPAIKEPANTAP
jgi:signal transduction histidine kinase